MKKFAFCIVLIYFQIIPMISMAQEAWKGYEKLFQPARNYIIYQVENELTIDGKADEPSWEQAAWTADFIDIEGDTKPQPKYRTRAKMLWDKNFLYILAELEEPQIWAYYKDHDQIVYHENDFEIFIDPDGFGRNYFEFELNAQNTLFDLLLPKPYRNGGKAMIGWDAPGFKSAVSIVGTLNDPTDTDKNWNVEIAIPFASLKMGLKNPVPSDGRQWKINFSRVEWQSVIVDGKYQKKKDEKTGRDLSENNWVWNPTGEINMHVPERWGLAQFSAKTVSSEKVAFQLSDQEALRKIVWMVYYKQQDFKKTHGHFALSLSDLKVPAVMNVSSGKTARIKLSAATNRFTVLLTTKEGLYLSLDENGLIQNGHHKN